MKLRNIRKVGLARFKGGRNQMDQSELSLEQLDESWDHY